MSGSKAPLLGRGNVKVEKGLPAFQHAETRCLQAAKEYEKNTTASARRHVLAKVSPKSKATL
jgi:hypothetical protein